MPRYDPVVDEAHQPASSPLDLRFDFLDQLAKSFHVDRAGAERLLREYFQNVLREKAAGPLGVARRPASNFRSPAPGRKNDRT